MLKEQANIKVYDKFGKFLSMCKPKRAEQLIARGNAFPISRDEILLLILRDDMKRIREYVYNRDNYTCQYCDEECKEDNITLDHLHPRSKGGSDFPDNLVVSCVDCNELKKDMTYEEFSLAVFGWVMFHFLWYDGFDTPLGKKIKEKKRKRMKYLKRIKKKS